MAHAVIKAKKSHDLLSTSWRTKKVGGVIQNGVAGVGGGGWQVERLLV